MGRSDKQKRKVDGDEGEGQSRSKKQKMKSHISKGGDEKGKMQYKYEKNDSFYGRINNNSRLAFVREIENRITSTDWQRILDGPFGKIVKMVQQVQFSSQLVHGMLFKQLETKKKWETWYGVGGKELRFSMQEYNIICGMDCDIPPKVDTNGDKTVMKRFFGGLGSTIQDIYERFKECRDDNNFKFKLALLLIVEGLILGGDKNRKVKVEHVKLLETMDLFYAYPWGRIGYKELNESLRKAMGRRIEAAKLTKSLPKQPRVPYPIRGLPIVF